MPSNQVSKRSFALLDHRRGDVFWSTYLLKKAPGFRFTALSSGFLFRKAMAFLLGDGNSIPQSLSGAKEPRAAHGASVDT